MKFTDSQTSERGASLKDDLSQCFHVILRILRCRKAKDTVELAIGCMRHTHDSGRSRKNKNTRFEQRRTAMHGKHSRMVFIPLYRNMVCYYGIDSRKCAIALAIKPRSSETLIGSTS